MTIRTLIVAAIASLCFTGSGLAQTVADFIGEQQKLTASDGAPYDEFGSIVAISGDTALVSAYWDDDNGTDSGSAYIYQRQADGSWSETSKLTASDGAASQRFGWSVAISGDTALVGAHNDDDNGSASGSAYLYEQQGDGTWSETKLTASDGADGDFFGHNVAISGTTALVGAYLDDDNGTNSGSAYIYQRQADGSWSEVVKLTASDGAADDYFSRGVAISGDTALVGAYQDDDNGSASGSAYIYQRQADGSWSETSKLTASDGAPSDYFGYNRVAISGDTALVGAYQDDDNGSRSGSAYLYQRQADGSWSETSKLTASDAASSDYFGYSVAISGEIALVGAYGDDDNGSRSGSAYIFQRQADGSWSEVAKLTPSDAAEYDYFGRSVAISGDTALVGSPSDDDNGDLSGSAYIYDICNVINLDYGNTGYASLDAAVQDAATGERLAVRSSAFDYAGIIDASNKALQFIAVEPIAMGTDLMFLPSDGSSFVDSDDVDEAGWSLAGRLIAPSEGSMIFSSLDTVAGGKFHQNDCSLLVNGPLATSGGVAYLSDEILAIEVTTGVDGINRVIRETEVLGDYLNDGTTAVHRGTLYIYGDLSGSGTMLGDVGTGPGLRGGDPPSPGDGFSIGGSSILGADASLRMLDFNWTLGIGGDVDWAIDDPSRFPMSGATLSLTGLDTGLQSLELMSPDKGAVETTDFQLGTLRVESGTVVTLVDTHDNASDGDASCEALYAGTIVIETGASLLTNGCPVYAREAIIKGELDGDVIIIGESCQGDEDGDGTVDVLDLLAVISAWGDCDEDCSADFDSNGTVDVIDLLIVIQYWGPCAD